VKRITNYILDNRLCHYYILPMKNQNNHNLDDLDVKILTVLQEDGRMPNKEISNRVGLVPSATSERLKKLKERGYIKSFETRLNTDKIGYGLVAFVFVRTNEMASGFQTGVELAKIPEVQEVFNVAGEDCYLIKIRTKNTQSLGQILRDKVGTIESVVHTRSTIVMEAYKETCKIPINGSAHH